MDRETRTAVDTECAAYHLSRKPQTLRIWASRENGPLRPLRVHGRLLWPVAEIRRLVGA
ncbi:MAG: DNA-binding protein [Ideonella sp.]|nr:DNA-binding protein [Ideonella sp.]